MDPIESNSSPAAYQTEPSAYKKHVWLATLSIILFMLVYLGICLFFFIKAVQLFNDSASGGSSPVLSFFLALLMGFLGVFMIKALFFSVKHDRSRTIEITEQDEPRLFAFINQVADEVKAPRPYKVFLSEDVNACVFYNISAANLFFPTRKNLEIGLGLVNVLNMGEFKSILAHEFGHFTQKSMLVGRWLYIASQVVNGIVYKRDAFDRLISTISGLDIRIAWVGWLLSIIVWSIRAISETFFKLAQYAQSALSHEMEFHADLVAVSVTGSDAIIHSLYKLGAADEAYNQAIAFANRQLELKKAVPDLFAIQSNAIQQKSKIVNDPAYGASPQITGQRSNFRVFKEQLAQPPKMWSSHPSNYEREKNAKAVYIPSKEDKRSVWELFTMPDETRKKLTGIIYQHLKEKPELLGLEESIAQHNHEFEHAFYSPQYRGMYLNRYTFTPVGSVSELYTLRDIYTNLEQTLKELYPESLKAEVEKLEGLNEELVLLEGLKNKHLESAGEKIIFRGKNISSKELDAAVDQVKKDIKSVERVLTHHDLECRKAHAAAARQMGNGWTAYLQYLAGIVHYCEHNIQEINQTAQYFYRTLSAVNRVGKVGDSDISNLILAALPCYEVMKKVYAEAGKIELTAEIKQVMNNKSLAEGLGEFKLPPVQREILKDWVDVLPGWIGNTTGELDQLHHAALSGLLKAEEKIKLAFLENKNAGTAPEISGTLPAVKLFNPEENREVLVKPGFLSRVYNAEGLLPSVLRLAAAAAIIISVFFYTAYTRSYGLYIVNGFGMPLNVSVDGKDYEINPGVSGEITIGSEQYTLSVRDKEGHLIESFVTPEITHSGSYIYNIKQAAPLYKMFVVYRISGVGFGNESNPEPQWLGAPKWVEADADYYFTDPPETITMSKNSDSQTRSSLMALTNLPVQELSIVNNAEERRNLLTAHLLYESEKSLNVLYWMALARELENYEELLNQRLQMFPLDVLALRMQQEISAGDKKDKICAQHAALFAGHPDNADLYYIHYRCKEEGRLKDSAMLAGHRRWPLNPWLNLGASFSYHKREQWDSVMACYSTINQHGPWLNLAVYDEAERISRLLNTENRINNFDRTALPYINYVNEIEEKSVNTGNALYAYKLLSEGKCVEALDHCKNDSAVYQKILCLSAVSDGAKQWMVKDAISLPDASVSLEIIAPMLSLAIKYQVPEERYMAWIQNSFDEEDAVNVKAFFSQLKQGDVKGAERAMGEVYGSIKARLSLLGVLCLNKNAPAKWYKLANKMLFINEKPYLKMFNAG